MRILLAAVLSCAAAAQPTPTRVYERPSIIVLGDSIAAGYGVGPAMAFPALLQAEIDAKGYPYRVVNEGISGETTSGGLNRLSEILARGPSVVIIELGGNDGLRGVPVTATRGNLDRMITEIRKSGAAAMMISMSLPPNYGPDFIRQFEGMYTELAVKHRIPLVKLDAAAFLADPRLLQRDGIHPTLAGHRRIAPEVWKQLEPLIKGKPARGPVHRP